MNITVVTKALSDGSVVYDLVLNQGDQKITLPAISVKDTIGLLVKLEEALKEHTNEPVTALWLTDVINA